MKTISKKIARLGAAAVSVSPCFPQKQQFFDFPHLPFFLKVRAKTFLFGLNNLTFTDIPHFAHAGKQLFSPNRQKEERE